MLGFSCNTCAFDFVHLLLLSILIYSKQAIRKKIFWMSESKIRVNLVKKD